MAVILVRGNSPSLYSKIKAITPMWSYCLVISDVAFSKKKNWWFWRKREEHCMRHQEFWQHRKGRTNVPNGFGLWAANDAFSSRSRAWALQFTDALNMNWFWNDWNATCIDTMRVTNNGYHTAWRKTNDKRREEVHQTDPLITKQEQQMSDFTFLFIL